MTPLVLVVATQLAAAEARPEAWAVISRRSGVAKPQAMELAKTVSAALTERGIAAPLPPEDAVSCAAKVPCLVDLAQKKGVSVLVAIEAGSALDDVVVHLEALSVEEFGKKVATFDFTGSAPAFPQDLKDRIEESFAPAVRKVLGLGAPVVKATPPHDAELPPALNKPPPEKPLPPEKKPEVVVTQPPKEETKSGMGAGKISGLAAMAVGAVLLASSAGVGIRVLGLESERKSLCPAGMPCYEKKAFDLFDSARGLQPIGVTLAVVGGLVAAAGAALFALDLGGDSSPTVAPAASSDGMGLTLSGRF